MQVVEDEHDRPQLARSLDKLAVIRSITGGVDEHASNMCFTGHPMAGGKPAGGWPNVGSIISKLQGQTKSDVPAFVAFGRLRGQEDAIVGAMVTALDGQFAGKNVVFNL